MTLTRNYFALHSWAIELSWAVKEVFFGYGTTDSGKSRRRRSMLAERKLKLSALFLSLFQQAKVEIRLYAAREMGL